MANILCPSVISCSPCPDGDPSNPNLSAEKPDLETFFAIVHYSDIPPLGGSWDSSQCSQLFTSTVSQADADLKALAAAQECAWTSGTGWRLPPTLTNRSGTPRRIFTNSAQQCSANCDDGSPFNFNVPPGVILSIISQADADEKARNYACKQAASERICLGPIKAFACQNAFYQDAIIAEAGPSNIASGSSWNLVGGSLPDGIAIFPTDDPFVLTVQGTPATIGLFVFTILLMLDNGDSASKTYSIEVGGIVTPSPLPDANTGQAYTLAAPLVTLAATGMTGSITWSILVGPLPAGMTLDPSTGSIIGTATIAGDYPITVQATDSA